MGGIMIGFIPWIVYFSIPSDTQTQINFAITVALALSVYLNRHDLKAGFILPWGTVAFFSFAMVAVVLLQLDWFAEQTHFRLLMNAMLAGIAWLSLFLHKPFTLQYAKKKVAADLWESPGFIHVNRMITMVWGLAFTVNMIVSALVVAMPGIQHWLVECITDGSTIVGLFFTFWFPDWYRNHQKKAA